MKKIDGLQLLKILREDLFNKIDEDGNFYYKSYSHEIIGLAEDISKTEGIDSRSELSIILKHKFISCFGDDWGYTNQDFLDVIWKAEALS